MLTPGPGTITLKLEPAPVIPPARQSLGKITLTKAAPMKVVVANDKPTEKEKDKNKDKAKDKDKDALGPVPALLCISSGEDSLGPPSIDLVRGRVDSTEPSHDTRRSHSRTNNEGVDFQAPSSAAAGRDRAQHLPNRCWSLWDSGRMFPKTALNPKITGKLDRGDYTIEKVVSKPSQVSP